MQAARNLDFTPDLMLPGISIKTNGAADPYPIEAMQIAKFSGTNFVLEGQIIQASSG